MAVRAPTWLSDALRWRWMPTVALIVGSLLYVLCAMLLVPSDIQFSAGAASATPRSPAANAAISAADVEGTAEADATGAADEPATTRRQKRQRRRAATAEVPAGEVPAPETDAPRAD